MYEFCLASDDMREGIKLEFVSVWVGWDSRGLILFMCCKNAKIKALNK